MDEQVMRRVVRLSDGRTLDAWIDPDESGVPLVFHDGTLVKRAAVRPAPGGRSATGPALGLVEPARLRLIDALRGQNRVRVVADTRDVLDQIGAGNFYVAGWSGGGPHALACAAFMPERVLGVSTTRRRSALSGRGS